MPASKQPVSLIAKYDMAIRSQEEVAAIMTARGFPMGRANVWNIEKRALAKLRKGLESMRDEVLFDK